MSFALLALVASAHAAGLTGGLYGGIMVTPYDLPPDTDYTPMQSGPTVVGRLGYTVARPLDIELDVGWVQSKTTQFGYVYDLFDPRLGLLYHFTPDARFDVFLGAGAGFELVTVDRPSVADTTNGKGYGLYQNPSYDFVINGGPGVTVWLVGPLHIRTDLRAYGTLGADATPTAPDSNLNMEWTIGLDFRGEKKLDKDGDGILDKVDQCVDDPEDKDEFEDEDGCPDLDNDKDGIPDTKDKCPNKPEDKDGFEDSDGCPDPDNDKDGLADGDDKCPNDPEDKDDFQDTDGCPDPDNDNDGIPDVSDKCVLQPETDNNYQDDDGCPDEVPVAVKKFTGVIKGIEFDNDKATIRKVSEKTLKEALSVLKEFPDMRLEVQGHTDSKADDAYNLDLSQRRAQAVVDWFVAHGIETGRLTPKGYGETVPIADNATDAGRQKNRRVEFKLIDK